MALPETPRERGDTRWAEPGQRELRRTPCTTHSPAKALPALRSPRFVTGEGSGGNGIKRAHLSPTLLTKQLFAQLKTVLPGWITPGIQVLAECPRKYPQTRSGGGAPGSWPYLEAEADGGHGVEHGHPAGGAGEGERHRSEQGARSSACLPPPQQPLSPSLSFCPLRSPRSQLLGFHPLPNSLQDVCSGGRWGCSDV